VAASAVPRPGIAGRLAGAFQANPLTPVLALLGLLLGVVALAITPREEEPQIDVTMANVIVPFPGADARQVEQMVAYPLEQVLSEIEGVEHTYSVSRPGKVVATVEFEVGVERQAALVRLYDKVFSHQDWMPQGLGLQYRFTDTVALRGEYSRFEMDDVDVDLAQLQVRFDF